MHYVKTYCGFMKYVVSEYGYRGSTLFVISMDQNNMASDLMDSDTQFHIGIHYNRM